MKKFFLTLLMLVSVCMSHAQTKHALVIGIGKYPAGSGWQRINGDRDADSVVNMLKGAGFKNIKCLKNEKATKANIVNGFKSLTTRCHKGDVVYIHFSGHGQQVKDADNDEEDGLDESWIPYDACVSPCAKDRGEKHLIDDEIGTLLDGIFSKVGAEGNILVVADACHSGSSTRRGDDDNEIIRGTDSVFQIKKCSRKTQIDENWILISACGDNQSNVEMKQPAMGKLTYALTWLVKNGCKDDNKMFKRRVQQFFDKHRSSAGEQTLKISGVTDRFNISKLFQEE